MGIRIPILNFVGIIPLIKHTKTGSFVCTLLILVGLVFAVTIEKKLVPGCIGGHICGLHMF